MLSLERIPEEIRKNKKTPKCHIKRATSRALRAARKQLERKYLLDRREEDEDNLYSVVIL